MHAYFRLRCRRRRARAVVPHRTRRSREDAAAEVGSRSVTSGRHDGRRAGGGAVRRHVAGHGAAARGRRAGGNGPRGVGPAWASGARPPGWPWPGFLRFSLPSGPRSTHRLLGSPHSLTAPQLPVWPPKPHVLPALYQSWRGAARLSSFYLSNSGVPGPVPEKPLEPWDHRPLLVSHILPTRFPL